MYSSLTASGSIVVVDQQSAQDQQVATGPFTRLAVSPTGSLIACFSASGTLWVMSTDFTKNLSEFGTGSHIVPLVCRPVDTLHYIFPSYPNGALLVRIAIPLPGRGVVW